MTSAEQNRRQPTYERTVVVGVDGSPEALVAARYGIWQAALRGLDVLLVYSYPLPLLDDPVTGEFIESFRAAGRTVLDDVVAALDVPPGVRLRTEVAETLPGVLLERLSESVPLVVVGQHVTAWYDRLSRGTVASPLAHHSRCPVVVVPPTWRADQQRGRPVVVALDGELASRAALELAFDQAELLGSDVVAVNALAGGTAADALAAERNLAELLAGVREDHPDRTARVVVRQGDTREVLLAAAQGAALLVVGPPHTDGLAVWTRSVARHVMTTVGCPLVVVPRQVPGAVPNRPSVLTGS